MQPIRSHLITLWRDGRLWNSGFLSEPGGTITLYPMQPDGVDPYTPATLPAGVKACPNLTLGHTFKPKQAQDATEAALRRYGYEIFVVDIIPW